MYTITYLVYVFSFLVGLPSRLSLKVVPQDPGCQDALGMENGKIANNKLFSPDKGFMPGREAYEARLNGNKAYCTPKSPDNRDGFYEHVYMTVDLGEDGYKLTALALQGFDVYTYGKQMQLWYYLYDHELIYKVNGTRRIPLVGKKHNNIEYLPLQEPIFSTKLKIQLPYTQTTHCLRMEIYGCKGSEFKEYDGCTSKQALLARHYAKMKFSATDAVDQDLKYSAKYLVFSKLYAWCLMASSRSAPAYEHWATIDMVDKYLIHGIEVRGYKQPSDDNNTKRFIAQKFKFKYSIDGVKRAYFEGRKELLTSAYASMKIFSTPLIARYIYISMKVDENGNLTCIKVEVNGCKAKLAGGTSPTSPAVNQTNTTTNPPGTTARIHRYRIYQGNEYSPGIKWIDSKYNGKKVDKSELNHGTGCLTDGKYSSNDNPFSSPACWIGWNKNKTKHPSIYIVLIRRALVKGVFLHTYVNESMGAFPINRITISAGTSTPLSTPMGYMCSPDRFYNQLPKIADYYISLDNTLLQYLQLKFEYSGQWILARQIEFIKEGELPKSAQKLSKSIIECKIPIAPSVDDADAWQVTVIVIIVLVMLLLILVAFIIHYYRTILFKARFKGDSIIVDRQERPSSNSINNGHFITSDPQRNKPYTKVQYNKINNAEEEIYAAVDNSFDSGVSSDQHVTYADCEDFRPKVYSPPTSYNNTPNGTMLYSIPDAKQYADPNTLKRRSVVYQGSAIYATTYENPYKATVASSLYAEPNKINQKTQVKVFPRAQLEFKERIGLGQFGEVHIAIATGLDDIYGSVGHYNSWDLPDTAMVAVKLLKSTDSEVEKEFMKEVEVMSRLKDENVVRLLGVCHEPPKLMVVEFMENGDLNQFLRERKPDMKNCRASQIGPNVLVLDHLLHIAQQVASGMKYLHSAGFIHRDLATRNCLVGPAYQVKISDFGMSRYVYTKHYYRVEGKAVLPIRWMAPECLYYGKFTSETDVWSFGVTLWEIFSFAKDSPFAEMSDPQVIEAACDLLQNPDRTFPYLAQSVNCPNDMYDIMKRCWTLTPANRPDFTCLSHELTEKCATSEGDI